MTTTAKIIETLTDLRLLVGDDPAAVEFIDSLFAEASADELGDSIDYVAGYVARGIAQALAGAGRSR